MEIVRCPVGHFYDKEKDSTCPVCAKGSTFETLNFDDNGIARAGDTTKPIDPPITPSENTSMEAIGFITEFKGFRLEGILSVVYDEKNNTFEVIPEHESLVHLNGGTLTHKAVIHPDDVLMLGNTRVFLTLSHKTYGSIFY